jgi:hypothetical protein
MSFVCRIERQHRMRSTPSRPGSPGSVTAHSVWKGDRVLRPSETLVASNTQVPGAAMPRRARGRHQPQHQRLSASGLDLLEALRGASRFAWLQGGAQLDTLVGTAKLRAALDRGASAPAIVAAEAAAANDWRSARRSALLYP